MVFRRYRLPSVFPVRGMPARLFFVAAAFCLVPAQAQAPADLRVALVIGNAAYARAPLLNPANDAQAMAKALKGLGFDVVELRDGSKEQMAEAIAKVRGTLKGKQGVGMLYYAGHGLQLDWRNYMVPVDARLAKATDVPEQTVDVGSVIEAFKTAGNRMNILVLDACRDNPFSGTASGKGLAQLDAPPGTFLAYATAPGNVAEDGDASTGNGLYTQFLLAELGKPTAKIEDVFKRVRLQVRQKSAGRQIPWESTSLEDDFYFNDKASVAAKAERDRLAASAAARDTAFALEKAAWDRIKDSPTAADFYAFLLQYPTGAISELAASRLEQLDRTKTVPQPDRDGVAQDAGAAWDRAGDRYSFVWKDGYTGVPMRTEQAVVDAVHGDVVEGRVGDIRYRSTQGGAAAEAIVGSFDPPLMLRPAGVLQVGNRFAGRSNFVARGSRQQRWVEWEGRVLSSEPLRVQAGDFRTFKVELNMLFASGARVKQTYWYVPGLGYPVRLDEELRRGGTADRSTREMVSFVRGSG